MTLRRNLGDDFTLCRSGIRLPVEEVFFFFSFFGRFVFAIFIFNLLTGFNLFLFLPRYCFARRCINVFLVIKDYFKH